MAEKADPKTKTQLYAGMSPSSLRTQIYADLRRRLQRAELMPGHRLVDTAVATQYRASRMPAREALMVLASQGFLQQTTRGFVVPELSAADVRDIFVVRKLLEPEAAATAARNLDDDGLSALAAARDLALETFADNDVEGLMEANIAFRRLWLSAVGNPRLVETIESFRDHIQVVRIATLRQAETRAVVIKGIETLAAAFAARDEAAVRAGMRAFMDAAEAEFFNAVRPSLP
ncbi:GntR family transcriptional regulator [Amorphus sp. 3PC139-8]|uniref:GntR family transcriptional regulator n=1 Tax=Amorphus sp. 3PC139-8 TaxID=2735676 RepID=UPI00345DB90D